MSKEKKNSWLYTGLTLLCMNIMIITSCFFRSVQLSGAKETGETGGRLIAITNFKADSNSVMFGHMLFFISLGLVWFIMFKYIKSHEVEKCVVPISLNLLIVILGCLIQFVLMQFVLPSDFFSSVDDSGFANISLAIWPICNFIMFAFMFIKAYI